MTVVSAEMPDLPPLAHTPWELATWVLIVIAVIGVAWVYSSQHGSRRGARESKYEVRKSHDINRRDNLDRLSNRLDDVVARLDEQDRDIRGIYEYLLGIRGPYRDTRDARFALERWIEDKVRYRDEPR